MQHARVTGRARGFYFESHRSSPGIVNTVILISEQWVQLQHHWRHTAARIILYYIVLYCIILYCIVAPNYRLDLYISKVFLPPSCREPFLSAFCTHTCVCLCILSPFCVQWQGPAGHSELLCAWTAIKEAHRCSLHPVKSIAHMEKCSQAPVTHIHIFVFFSLVTSCFIMSVTV